MLGDGATLVIVNEALSKDVLRDYACTTALVEQRSSIAAFGHRTMPAEVAYTAYGKPYMYSGVRSLFMSRVGRHVPDNVQHNAKTKLCWATSMTT